MRDFVIKEATKLLSPTAVLPLSEANSRTTAQREEESLLLLRHATAAASFASLWKRQQEGDPTVLPEDGLRAFHSLFFVPQFPRAVPDCLSRIMELMKVGDSGMEDFAVAKRLLFFHVPFILWAGIQSVLAVAKQRGHGENFQDNNGERDRSNHLILAASAVADLANELAHRVHFPSDLLGDIRRLFEQF